ncbi:hypothetical protein D3C72_2440490 [compost metagenome]
MIPALRTTSPNFTRRSDIIFSKAAGVISSGAITPRSLRLACMAGDVATWRTALYSVCTMGSGVPPGAASPVHELRLSCG